MQMPPYFPSLAPDLMDEKLVVRHAEYLLVRIKETLKPN